MDETVSSISKEATHKIIEQGITGSMMVLFFITAGLLLYMLLKDRDYQKTIAEALTDMADNQKNFNEQYMNFQEYHQKVVGLITDVTKAERSNTQECYSKVIGAQVGIDKKLDEILRLVQK